MSILPQGYANAFTPVFETNQTPDAINIITTSGLAVATRTGNTVNINVPAFGAENLADTLTAGNSAGANQINMNSNKIINCLNPTDPQDVATKAYVDAYSPAADSLASVLAISNVVGATGINMNNTQRVYNCINPVSAQDVATKAYVDGLVGSTPTLKAVMTAGNVAGNTLNMDGYDITNGGSITAGGITEAINFGTLITPMLTNNQYATNVSINGINPLITATTITGVGGVDISSSAGPVSISCPLNKDLGISGGDVNITQLEPTSVMNITSTGAMALVSGIGLDISATATVLINSQGNISIGSGNALGADVEVEKIAFKENKIYKAITVPVPADIQIEDVASIVNVGDPIAINGSTTNISAQANGAVNITATGTGAVNITAPDVGINANVGSIVLTATGAGNTVDVEQIRFSNNNISTTVGSVGINILPQANQSLTMTSTGTGDINLNSQDQINIRSEGGSGFADITLFADDAISATCKGAFTAGSTLGITTIQGATTNVGANPNGTVNITTTGSGNVFISSQNFITAVSDNFDLSNQALTLISDTATGQATPILKLQNNSTTGGATNPVVIQTVKNDSTPVAGDVICELTARGTINTGALQDYTRIQSIATNIGGTAAGVDGTLQLQCITNGVYNTYMTLNGSTQQINAGKDLIMGSNNITGINKIGTTNGGATTGLDGQSLVSGGALGARWNYKMIGYNVGTGGSSSVDNTTFNDIFGNIPIALTTGSFIRSPTNKYKITVNGSFEGVNDVCKMELQINSGTGGNVSGLTFGSGGLFYYVENVNIGGTYYTSYSFSDIFDTSTNPLSEGGLCYVYCLVQTATGSHTISNNKHNVMIEPVYN